MAATEDSLLGSVKPPSPKSSTAPPENARTEPLVEVELSRPAYRLGGSIVGTIRLLPGSSNQSPRQVFSSALVFVAGWCRIDPRWHNVSTYSTLYGKVHPNLEGLHPSVSDGGSDNTVCFWASNVVELMNLKERTIGKWNDVKPKPIEYQQAKKVHQRARRQGNPASKEVALEDRQLAFTFRVHLPPHLPHSFNANSCRYYYSVVVYAKAKVGQEEKVFLVRSPLTVLTQSSAFSISRPQQRFSARTRGRVSLATCTAMAHSAGLPCHVSATELHRPSGQMTVNRKAASFWHAASSPMASPATQLQTLRVSDPMGRLCCVLTLLGGASDLSPGSRLILKFDFPQRSSSNDNDDWVSCYQISSCLDGEEVAVYEDGTRKRARSFLFDAAHEIVDPGYSDRVCLSMILPLDCPCTIETDLVQLSIRCLVELTVGNASGDGYTNLRLELPCQVVHSSAADEVVLPEETDNAGNSIPLEELVLGKQGAASLRSKDPLDPSSFRTHDIMDDLKTLSLNMIDACGLRE